MFTVVSLRTQEAGHWLLRTEMLMPDINDLRHWAFLTLLVPTNHLLMGHFFASAPTCWKGRSTSVMNNTLMQSNAYVLFSLIVAWSLIVNWIKVSWLIMNWKLEELNQIQKGCIKSDTCILLINLGHFVLRVKKKEVEFIVLWNQRLLPFIVVNMSLLQTSFWKNKCIHIT